MNEHCREIVILLVILFLVIVGLGIIIQINISYLVGAFILWLFMLQTARKWTISMNTSPTPVEF